MTKIRLAVSADVLFDRNPPLLFGPDLLAVHTDGQESTQRLDLFERGMQGLVRVFQTLHCLPPVLLNRGNEDGHTAEHNRSCYSAHAKIQHIWRTVKEQIKKENRNERDNETCRSACVSGNNNDCSHKEQIAAMHYKSRKRKRQQSGGNEAGNYDDRDTLARHRDTPFNACLLISAIESFCVSASSPSEERASRNGPIITICPQGISDASHSWRKNRAFTCSPPGHGGTVVLLVPGQPGNNADEAVGMKLTEKAGRNRLIVYWVATTILAMELLVGGAWDVLMLPQVREVFHRLGYPVYVLVILGVWKLLGSIAITIPRFPRLKEWAYAGAVFDLTGALASNLVSGVHDATTVAYLVGMIAITAVSWAMRPPSRRTFAVR